MMTAGVAFGQRVVLLTAAGPAPEVPARVLLPGVGRSVRERARDATPRPVAEPSVGRGKNSGGRTMLTPSGSGRKRLIRSGEPSDAETFRRRMFGVDPAPVDAAAAYRVGGLGPAGVASRQYEVLGDWGYWQHRIAHLADDDPGSELAALLEERPALADAPVEGGAEVDSFRARLRLDSMAARSRLINAWQGDQLADAAALAQEYPHRQEFLAAEVAVALQVSESEAGAMLTTAFALVQKLPATLAAVQAGRLGRETAEVMAGALAPVTDAAVCARIEAVVLPRVIGSGRSRESVRREVNRQVIRFDPDGADARHGQARKARNAAKFSAADGMGTFRLIAPLEDVAVTWDVLTGLAQAVKGAGDDRTLDQRRVDVHGSIFRAISDAGGWEGINLPKQHGRKPQINVLIPQDILFDAGARAEADAGARTEGDVGARAEAVADVQAEADARARTKGDAAGPAAKAGPGAPDDDCSTQTASTSTTSPPSNSPFGSEHEFESGAPPTDTSPGPAVGPVAPVAPVGPVGPVGPVAPSGPGVDGQPVSFGVCEISGYGPISRVQALSIAAQGVWRRLVCDPLTGMLLDYGHTRYIPPDSLKQFVLTRDQECGMFGCHFPASRCQIDHVVPYAAGGLTAADNLGALCQHNHRAKDGGGWRLTFNPDRSKTTTTPLGYQATKPPHRFVEPTPSVPPDGPNRRNPPPNCQSAPGLQTAESQSYRAVDEGGKNRAHPKPEPPPPF